MATTGIAELRLLPRVWVTGKVRETRDKMTGVTQTVRRVVVILNADDFGLTEGVCEGIVQGNPARSADDDFSHGLRCRSGRKTGTLDQRNSRLRGRSSPAHHRAALCWVTSAFPR